MSTTEAMKTRAKTAALLLASIFGISVALTGCGEQAEPSAETPKASEVQETTLEPTEVTPEPEEPTCADLTGSEAVLKWIGEVPPHPLGLTEGINGWGVGGDYDPYVDYETYDPCAALSWVAILTAGGSGSSDWVVMIFHEGDYVGTATEQPIPYGLKGSRISDSVIQLDYLFPKDGESTAAASGWAVSTFTWDEESASVLREGELPPSYTGTD